MASVLHCFLLLPYHLRYVVAKDGLIYVDLCPDISQNVKIYPATRKEQSMDIIISGHKSKSQKMDRFISRHKSKC